MACHGRIAAGLDDMETSNVNAPSPLDISICIANEETRIRCVKVLQELKAAGRFEQSIPWYTVSLAVHRTQQDVLDYLQPRFQNSGEQAALLLSDQLCEATGEVAEPYLPTSWAKELIKTFEDRFFGTVAFMDRYRRVLDIDRTIRQNFEPEELLDTLSLSAERLTYIRPPLRRTLSKPVVVRLIRNEIELEQYFRLRHRVYRVMGYLKPNVEFARSGMEMDWCDTTALHIGAFEQDGQRENLIGTARVVSVNPLDTRSDQWTRALARGDTALRREVEKDALGLVLPIFYSVRMKYPYKQLMTQEPNCGELSRVIVQDSHRGMGLSLALSRFAVLQATARGVSRLFLECLHLHAGLYRKLGFETMDGATGRVFGVNRTMTAMEMTPNAIEALKTDAIARRHQELIKDRGYLCICQFDNCAKDKPEIELRKSCPNR